MPRKPKRVKEPVGRPQLLIDWDQVDKMLIAHCNGVQVAAAIGVAPDTLYDRCMQEKGVNFTTYSQEKQQKGKNLLLQKQLQVAMQGNTTMLVWLGKQHLLQKDGEAAKDSTIRLVVERKDVDPESA